MTLKGNKGEWSEIYVLLKLLGEGSLHAGDEHLHKLKDLFFPIIMILRREHEEELRYKPTSTDVVVTRASGEELLRLPAADFLRQAESLLGEIRTQTGTFPVPAVESFMQQVHCRSLKAASADKTDIRIVLHDRRTCINQEMGFSIKSQLGSKATLLNAGLATNFRFKIVGGTFSDEDIAAINAMDSKKDKVMERVRAISLRGGRLVFDKPDSVTFRNNLILLDSDLPAILGHLLLERMERGKRSLKELAEALTETNPLRYDLTTQMPYYDYKLKQFLTAVALGLTPARVWNGKLEANGGYIVVRKDGEIVCYHFYDRNRFEEYLFACTELETSSTRRHKYAQIIKEQDGTLTFKLNLQIRMG